MSNAIAVINTGSSSIKFSLFSFSEDKPLQLLCRGQAEGIGVTPQLKVIDARGKKIVENGWTNTPEIDHDYLMHQILGWIRTYLGDKPIRAVGHRVVHGGSRYRAPVILNASVLKELEDYIPLAPLHQPHNLKTVSTIAEQNPDIVQVACFDTAFHATIPEVAQAFALPRSLSEQGVRKYGFHGLSYEYISQKFNKIAPDIASGRVIVAHLGSGTSMCALLNGKSLACTLGFSALGGLPMGTRTGDLDPGVVLYLMQVKGMSAADIETLMYKESGLLGVSGISNDMRVLLNSRAPEAREAVDLFIYRINRELGSMMAALGGLDALVFTAGIGEHSAQIRERICSAAQWTGLSLDTKANQNNAPCITTTDSPVSAWVIPTDEELMIATHTRDLVAGVSHG